MGGAFVHGFRIRDGMDSGTKIAYRNRSECLSYVAECASGVMFHQPRSDWDGLDTWQEGGDRRPDEVARQCLAPSDRRERLQDGRAAPWNTVMVDKTAGRMPWQFHEHDPQTTHHI
jgi:hypothetical protein